MKPLTQFTFEDNEVWKTTNPQEILSKKLFIPDPIVSHQFIDSNNNTSHIGHILAENLSSAKVILKDYYNNIPS